MEPVKNPDPAKKLDPFKIISLFSDSLSVLSTSFGRQSVENRTRNAPMIRQAPIIENKIKIYLWLTTVAYMTKNGEKDNYMYLA